MGLYFNHRIFCALMKKKKRKSCILHLICKSTLSLPFVTAYLPNSKMFTLPPIPPKDYILKDVNNSLRSSPQFTPDALPRVTQSNIGKFCFPIQYGNDEVPEKRPPVKLVPVIKEKMTNDARASWVVEPGKNDFFIHDVYRKYTISESPKNYDPRYKHKGMKINLKTGGTVQVDRRHQKIEMSTRLTVVADLVHVELCVVIFKNLFVFFLLGEISLCKGMQGYRFI